MCGLRQYVYGCGCDADPKYFYCDNATKKPNGSGKVPCGSGLPPGEAKTTLPKNFCSKPEHNPHMKEPLPPKSWD